MPTKKKGPGRPKKEKTKVVSFRYPLSGYNEIEKEVAKPEQLAKEHLDRVHKKIVKRKNR